MTDPEPTPPAPPPLPVMLEYQPPPEPEPSDLGPPGPIARWFLIGCNQLGRFVGLFVRKS
jgi:hypothetical protein